MDIKVLIIGLDHIVNRLEQNNVESILSSFTYRVAEQVQTYTGAYAPLSEANSPANPRGYWYERGYGWKGKIDKPVSEQLGTRWGISRERRVHNTTTAVITNSASYSLYVHSEQKQLGLHKLRGWRTDKDGIEYVKPLLNNILSDKLKDFW